MWLQQKAEPLVTPRFSGPRLAEKTFLGGLHWVLRDAKTRGLVLEFVEGKLMTYEDREVALRCNLWEVTLF